ncbi:hypothetical protein PoB_005699100 [Plakobranchus ocellatus]|uniref:Uncharacterized protein n=1 Tax=Plakobranchus ocellatus TaxID=259542 RepID=A0AAV4CCK5_9GAST|nr:hypothetical protein PoB_005699100 [Plakobranchus ocellatus]
MAGLEPATEATVSPTPLCSPGLSSSDQRWITQTEVTPSDTHIRLEVVYRCSAINYMLISSSLVHIQSSARAAESTPTQKSSCRCLSVYSRNSTILASGPVAPPARFDP